MCSAAATARTAIFCARCTAASVASDRAASSACTLDEEAVRQQLFEHVSQQHIRGTPLCWVEMSTPHYYFFRGNDFAGAAMLAGGPPKEIIFELC